MNVRRAALPLLLAPLAAAILTGCGETKAVAPASPTTAAAPAASAASAAYRRDANATLDALAQSAGSVADVMSKADPQSATWRASLTTNLNAVSAVNARAKALVAPPSDAEIQQRLVEVAGDFDQAAQLIRGAIDPVDVDALDRASQILTAAVTKVGALRTILPTS